MTTLALANTTPADAQADALVIFSGKGSGKKGAAAPIILAGTEELPKAATQHILTALSAFGATGKADEVIKLHAVPKITAATVLVAGSGAQAGEEPTLESIRRASGAAVRALNGTQRVAIVPPRLDEDTVGAVSSGACLGSYHFDQHRSAAARKDAKAPVGRVDIIVGKAGNKRLTAAAANAEVIARQQNWARDLVNLAPNELYPQSFAEAVKKRAPRGVKISVLDEAALAEGGFGGIIGVGQGSARPPRIVTMSYEPSKAKTHLALVGKGITFDSGGLCIKPGGSMVTMKCDMGGAAAVAAAVLAVAELGLPVAVTGYLCLAENMPSANAQRPGDVVTMRNGMTVEIINTDAEGRMVLGDGISLAAESGPDAIVDVATLTGAAIVALGNRTAAVMANDDELQGSLTSAAAVAGESVWPMPITEETRAGMDSVVADIKHTGEPVGGSMVAAAFLREFAKKGQEGEPISWGHIDIAGPAYNDGSAFGYTPKGGTGFSVATLVEFARGYC
ncbi:leucyl aminopeptidase [Gephyromycinifex aptenodytis]|uniref:leucyl aminopeptidase n=1 Tax=Gephyromycinifex aptenodytis TaxID=2716227 RepID=UPI001445F0D0|nr:leucyl aminopeptidase [Gephyromycinifex aptenodytis]